MRHVPRAPAEQRHAHCLPERGDANARDDIEMVERRTRWSGHLNVPVIHQTLQHGGTLVVVKVIEGGEGVTVEQTQDGADGYGAAVGQHETRGHGLMLVVFC